MNIALRRALGFVEGVLVLHEGILRDFPVRSVSRSMLGQEDREPFFGYTSGTPDAGALLAILDWYKVLVAVISKGATQRTAVSVGQSFNRDTLQLTPVEGHRRHNASFSVCKCSFNDKGRGWEQVGELVSIPFAEIVNIEVIRMTFVTAVVSRRFVSLSASFLLTFSLRFWIKFEGR